MTVKIPYPDTKMQIQMCPPTCPPGWPSPEKFPTVVDVVRVKNGNGEIVDVATDENGDIVATKKETPAVARFFWRLRRLSFS